MDRLLNKAKQVAKSRNITNWDTLDIAKAKNKRFSIVSPAGKKINFGLWPFQGKGSFLDHGDNTIREAWRARHSKILLKDGKEAYKDKESPEYYSWHILW
jgi:hypothetical protein